MIENAVWFSTRYGEQGGKKVKDLLKEIDRL